MQVHTVAANSALIWHDPEIIATKGCGPPAPRLVICSGMLQIYNMSGVTDDNLVIKALTNQARRHMLNALTSGPQTTGAISALVPEFDRTTVMQHLGVLVEAGLVIPEKRDREHWNHLDTLPIQAIHQRWIGPLITVANQDPARLENTQTIKSEEF